MSIDDLMPVATYRRELELADQAFARNDYQTAQEGYMAILNAIDNAVKAEQRSLSCWSTLLGGVLGFLVPVVGFITAPIAAYLVYQTTKDGALSNLRETDYWELYTRALDGMLQCMKHTEKKRR